MKELQDRVPGLADTVLSVHCHDDLGLAVANSLAGVQVGAGQVEVAVNGIGERAGNASLEEVVMALTTRKDHYDAEVDIETRQLANTSRMISNITGYEVPPNKAIVGRNAFLHESGIHQDGVLKDRRTFEIMKQQDVGIEGTNIFLGKHSGRHALKEALEELGYEIEGEVLKRAFERFKDVADHKKTVTAADLEAIAADEVGSFEGKYAMGSLRVVAATGRQSRAAVTVSHEDHGVFEAEAEGEGPVDAVFRAIDAATNIKGRLTDFRIDAVTGGKDALGEVRVSVEFEGSEYAGRGLSQDVVEAAARAYVRAVNVYTAGKLGATRVAYESHPIAEPFLQHSYLYPDYERLDGAVPIVHPPRLEERARELRGILQAGSRELALVLDAEPPALEALLVADEDWREARGTTYVRTHRASHTSPVRRYYRRSCCRRGSRPPSGQRTEATLPLTVWHELAHAFLLQKELVRTPPWLQEFIPQAAAAAVARRTGLPLEEHLSQANLDVNFDARAFGGPADAERQMEFQNVLLALGDAALEEFGEGFLKKLVRALWDEEDIVNERRAEELLANALGNGGREWLASRPEFREER